MFVEGAPVLGAEVHASWFGAEASIYATTDLSDELNADAPQQLDYRLSYSFKALTSINTVAVEYHDFGNLGGKLGTSAQGFDVGAPVFEDDSLEVVLSSYWFNDKIQINASNYFLGFDVWVPTQEIGVRAAATIGVFTANVGEEPWLPNGARLQASIIYQYE